MTSVSVGICAYNEEDRIGAALASLRDQVLPEGVEIGETLVVASGCTDGTEAVVASWSASHPGVRLVHEAERRGKASALNRILAEYRGEVLVLLNADARLGPGALAALLRPLLEDPSVEIACGCPVPDDGVGTVRGPVERGMWGLHNRTLDALSSQGVANHCCDEFLAFRRRFLSDFPPAVVNDGAYLGVLAARQGVSVRFCRDARVIIAVPPTLRGIVAQRRRILRGHRQVIELLGQRPNVFREVAKRQPGVAARILLGVLADDPWSGAALFLVGFPLEAFSGLLSYADGVRQPAYQPAWPVVDRL